MEVEWGPNGVKGIESGDQIERTEAFWAGSTNSMKQNGLPG